MNRDVPCALPLASHNVNILHTTIQYHTEKLTLVQSIETYSEFTSYTCTQLCMCLCVCIALCSFIT